MREHPVGDAATVRMVSAPMTPHCSAVDSSMRVNVEVVDGWCRGHALYSSPRAEQTGVPSGWARRSPSSAPCCSPCSPQRSSRAVNGPGNPVVAEPVLWALGGGAGMTLGAVVTAWISRRAGAGVLAAFLAPSPCLVLVVLAYNSTDLRSRTSSSAR